MALSDEDYGILLNAIENKEVDWDTGTITSLWADLKDWRGLSEAIQNRNQQLLLDFAFFIILSEGRELP